MLSDDEELEIESLDGDYDENEFEQQREPAEEFNEDDDSVIGEEEAEDFRRERGERAREDANEDDDAEDVDGLPDDVSLKQIAVMNVQSNRRTEKAQMEMIGLLKQLLRSGGSLPTAAPPHRGTSHTSQRPPRRNLTGDSNAKLPLDWSLRGLFGPGWRKQVTKVIAPTWFKRVGAQYILLPYSTIAPLAMRACSLDEADENTRNQFDFYYKSETSKVGSKVKNDLSNMFMDQLLALEGLPSIVDAGSAHPAHMAIHKPAFQKLHDPPGNFSPTDPRYKYMASWLAGIDSSGVLKAFETTNCRKLFEVDFFARAAAKGLLPPSAHKWNLGSLAYFILFAQQRLTIKRGAANRDVYGNLKDGADALVEIERICDWLMNPIACPTTWPVLLTIRRENPMYGGQPPVAA